MERYLDIRPCPLAATEPPKLCAVGSTPTAYAKIIRPFKFEALSTYLGD